MEGAVVVEDWVKHGAKFLLFWLERKKIRGGGVIEVFGGIFELLGSWK